MELMTEKWILRLAKYHGEEITETHTLKYFGREFAEKMKAELEKDWDVVTLEEYKRPSLKRQTL